LRCSAETTILELRRFYAAARSFPQLPFVTLNTETLLPSVADALLSEIVNHDTLQHFTMISRKVGLFFELSSTPKVHLTSSNFKEIVKGKILENMSWKVLDSHVFQASSYVMFPSDV